jgi:aminopeptidase N/puromycin-sensitive aminopeptidase
MVEGYVGAARYREAINAYVKKFAFSNATGEGLWTTVAAVTGKPIDRILAGFITQGGVPLVTVRATCTGGATELVLSQRPISDAVPSSTVWDIPVCYKRARGDKAGGEACVLLSTSTQTATVEGCSSWVFANADGRGYYRAAYDAANLRALGDAAANGQLTPREQTTLLEDVWALVRSGDESIAPYLSLSGQLAKNAASPAVATALSRINFISERLVDASRQPAFRRWVVRAVGPLMARVGWTPAPGETEDVQSLRSAVIFTMGNAGRDPAVLREAGRLARLHIDGAALLHSSLIDTTLRLAAIVGDAALYDLYFARVAGGGSPAGQRTYLRALSFFAQPELQKRTLAYATSRNIRTQDTATLIQSMMERPWGSSATWEHVKDNWHTIEQSLDIFQGVPDVAGAVRHFCDAGARHDVEQFFSGQRTAAIERTVRQSLEAIDRCAATKSAQAQHLSRFLEAIP